MCANGGEVKLGEDPQPPAVTNQGATLFLKEDLKDLTPVICQNHFFCVGFRFQTGSSSPPLFPIQPLASSADSSKQPVSVWLE